MFANLQREFLIIFIHSGEIDNNYFYNICHSLGFILYLKEEFLTALCKAASNTHNRGHDLK
jgi:hypothetical protein